ncbi:hypothetical protein KI387_022498, partial [Taxus chinensis]
GTSLRMEVDDSTKTKNKVSDVEAAQQKAIQVEDDMMLSGMLKKNILEKHTPNALKDGHEIESVVKKQKYQLKDPHDKNSRKYFHSNMTKIQVRRSE